VTVRIQPSVDRFGEVGPHIAAQCYLHREVFATA
jgi:hypothetical protein